MVLALAGGRRPSLIAGPGGLPRSGRWRGFVGFASVLPFVHPPVLRATSRQREGMGLVCWSDWDVESFVPKCETSRGFCATPRRKRRFCAWCGTGSCCGIGFNRLHALLWYKRNIKDPCKMADFAVKPGIGHIGRVPHHGQNSVFRHSVAQTIPHRPCAKITSPPPSVH